MSCLACLSLHMHIAKNLISGFLPKASSSMCEIQLLIGIAAHDPKCEVSRL